MVIKEDGRGGSPDTHNTKPETTQVRALRRQSRGSGTTKSKGHGEGGRHGLRDRQRNPEKARCGARPGLGWQAGAGASVAVCVGRSGGLSVTVGVGPEADVVQEEGIVSGEVAGSSGDVVDGEV